MINQLIWKFSEKFQNLQEAIPFINDRISFHAKHVINLELCVLTLKQIELQAKFT